MAIHFTSYPRAISRAAHFSPLKTMTLLVCTAKSLQEVRPRSRIWRVRVSNGGGDSYLDMWKNAVDRDRKSIEFQKIAEKSAKLGDEEEVREEELGKRTEEFQKILEVSKEERDRIQRMQVIDRAAAAIAAARAILNEGGLRPEVDSGDMVGPVGVGDTGSDSGAAMGLQIGESGSLFVPSTGSSGNATPGPDFWSWTPPLDGDGSSDGFSGLQPAKESLAFTTLSIPVVEKERTVEFLSIPLESKLNESIHNPLLPPLQSLMAVEKVELSESSPGTSSIKEEHDIEVSFSTHAAEAADALHSADKSSSYGVRPDGSRWWKETGTERRPDGVICRWTLTRGVSADQDVEWQDKFWEAADDFGYKELGSEKLGRNATGDVWREYWKESMWQECGLVHLEKTADKWGKNGKGDEWQEKWWEQYNASGKADKWAHKWCSIDPNTLLEAGHAHVWHERWGEKYDGHGGSIKYTDKWAERCEGDAWTKWGDKWDENFDPNGHGVKQGETWWEGKYGERWNRTWGEGHSGSGWVHKYGKSSSGEHWDTHEQQDTWYERFPHFSFYHCFDNSVQLREVKNPSDHES